jgi:hypothetical protein
MHPKTWKYTKKWNFYCAEEEKYLDDIQPK